MTTLPPLGDSLQPDHRLRRIWMFVGVAVVVCVAAFLINGQFTTEDDHTKVAAGDCFENTGSDKEPRIKKRDCGDPQAEYKALKKLDGAVTGLACSDVEGATGALTQISYDKKSFVVCYTSNRR
ncbi:hypothetical protein WEB32_04985 [Streptomyces netropsis]|uniref:Uncharacterized protein n=1 Tax=Streptomyces netropsis TaxID=55404 RepID=A0A7W7LG10_STRNE|nr:hypothetical protein [Streptomyces netropsis]MBB4888988.1 hypothetical protein [Streptomyces netropsis]GGR11137.1 hypothetical protein GCM10010219_14990 [Streptomyces netropsis]